MKESITKFDLEAAFKALDEIEAPKADKVKANRPALTEIFSRKSKFDALMEEYYDVNDMSDLDDAKEAREAEVAQAKLARIEKIVDLDAESPEDLLPSYVGKFIMQCPQCMTLFYKNPEDVEASEENPDVVNVNEVCQHCGNEAGYTLVGKVGEATQDEMSEYTEEETVDVMSTDEAGEETLDDSEESISEEDVDLDIELDDLDLDLEDEPEEEKTEESFNTGSGEQTLNELLSLHEGAAAETKQAVRSVMSKLAEEDKNAWAKTTAEIIDVIPDDVVDSIANELSKKFNDFKLDAENRKKIAAAAKGELEISEETDTVGKLLDMIDPYEFAKSSPGLMKTIIVTVIAIIGVIEPTPIVEIIALAVAALPAEIVAEVMAIVSPGVTIANKLYKWSKNRAAAKEDASLTESIELDISADEFETLINSPEFKKPISDVEARAMMNELDDNNKDEMNEAVKVNNETLKFAVINPDGTYAGVPCTSEEEARELAAQREGRVIVELGALREGIFDKITDKLKTREAKADWLLANALKNYDNIEPNEQTAKDDDNKKFSTFAVICYTSRNKKGDLIKSAPAFNDKTLVVAKNGVKYLNNYKEAEKVAKAWSDKTGNGPAFICLTTGENDNNAAFICEYFKGSINNDMLDTYFKSVKDSLSSASAMPKDNKASNESLAKQDTVNNALDAIMESIEDIKEAVLENCISDSLIEAYGNVAGFRLTECTYADNKLTVDGTIFFTSGNKRNTSYVFSEALSTGNKTSIHGLNEKLGNNKQFIITGHVKDKTFITESFNTIKK